MRCSAVEGAAPPVVKQGKGVDGASYVRLTSRAHEHAIFGDKAANCSAVLGEGGFYGVPLREMSVAAFVLGQCVCELHP